MATPPKAKSRVVFTLKPPRSAPVHTLFAPARPKGNVLDLQQRGRSRNWSPPRSRDQSPKRSAPPSTFEAPPLTEPETPAEPGKEHKVTIYIDHREATLRQLVAAAYADAPNENIIDNVALPVGDIRIDCDGHPCMLIERKEVSDFLSSLYDGRFREQRSRLIDARKENPNLILMFAFEGSLDAIPPQRFGRFSREYVRSMAEDLPRKYNIHERWLASPAALLVYVGHVERCYRKYGAPVNIIADDKITDSFHVGKKREIDPKGYALLALSLIRGVSTGIAEVIVAEYSTIADLVRAYSKIRDKDSDKKRKLMLADLKHGKAQRRVGKAVSTRIYEHLYRKSD